MILWLAACTFAPGTGFTELARVELSVALEPGAARDLGDGVVLSDLAYAVRIEEALLEVDAVRVETLLGGGSFDPANPPPGYTLCHGGHCHADGGRLVDYSEVIADIGGGRWSEVAVAPIGRSLDLDEGAVHTVTEVAPSPHLPATGVTRAVIDADRLVAYGTATAGPLGEEEVSWVAEIAPSEPFTVDVASVDRDLPAVTALIVHLPVDGTLFDGVDFATLAVEGTASIDVLDNLLRNAATASFEEE